MPTTATAYSNPYTNDTDDIVPIELLPYSAEDYDIRTVLKYTEFLHHQHLVQPARTAQGEPLYIRYGVVRAHDSQHASQTSDSTSTLPRRVVQIVDDSTQPLPAELIDVLEYVEQLTGLAEHELLQQRFQCEVKQVVAPSKAPSLSVDRRSAKRQKANASPAPPSPPTTPAAAPVAALTAVAETTPAEVQRPVLVKATPTQSTDASSSWNYGQQTDRHGHARTQKTLAFGSTRPQRHATAAPDQQKEAVAKVNHTQTVTHSQVIKHTVGPTIPPRQPFVLNAWPISFKRTSFAYHVPRSVGGSAQNGSHILCWLERTTNVAHSPILQLCIFLHRTLNLPLVVAVTPTSDSYSVDHLQQYLTAQHIPLLLFKVQATYSAAASSIADYMQTMKPHMVITEEMFDGQRATAKQQLVASLQPACTLHALDTTHLTPIRYMKADVSTLHDVTKLLLERLNTLWPSVVSDTAVAVPYVIDSNIQQAVADLNKVLPADVHAILADNTDSKLKPTVDDSTLLSQLTQLASQLSATVAGLDGSLTKPVELLRTLLESGTTTYVQLLKHVNQHCAQLPCECVVAATDTLSALPPALRCDQHDGVQNCAACSEWSRWMKLIAAHHLIDLQTHRTSKANQ